MNPDHRFRRLRFPTWRPGNYLRASARLLAWLLVRAAAQATTVVLLARSLGPRGYGEFVAAVAIASFLTPVAGIGLQAVMLREGATRQASMGPMLRNALRLWSRSATLACLAGVGVAAVVLPGHTALVPLAPLALLVIGESASTSLVEILGRARQARQRPEQYGALMAGLSLTRLAGVLVLLAAGAMSLDAWMITYWACSTAYAGLAAASTWRSLGAGREPPDASAGPKVLDGLPFLGGALAFRLQAEFNKPLLARIGYALAGNFNAAQRAIELASLPLTALQEALWPRVFASPEPGRQLRRVGAMLFGLALLAALVVMLAAPHLPALLGAGFADTARVLAWLAWLPAVQVLRNLGNASLMSRRDSAALWRVYLVGTVLATAFTAWAIAFHGLAGAVAAAYMNEAVMLAAQWCLGGARGARR